MHGEVLGTQRNSEAMSAYDDLDTLIASDSKDMSVENLLELQRRVAGERYFLAGHVATLKGTFLRKEANRKSIFATSKLKVKADHVGSRALGDDAAKDSAEQRPEVIVARSEEISAEIEFEHARLRFSAADGVLSSLQMRLADARDERKQSRLTQNP